MGFIVVKFIRDNPKLYCDLIHNSSCSMLFHFSFHILVVLVSDFHKKKEIFICDQEKDLFISCCLCNYIRHSKHSEFISMTNNNYHS